MASSLLALLDDIATILDDVAVLSKVAAKKTAGVLGDDLALNAQQVSGVAAERELPVVWAVCKGSFVNKLILVPSALLISAFAPVWIGRDRAAAGRAAAPGRPALPGYLDDDTVPKGSLCPTFAAAAMFINNARWDGVPFLLKAGKALSSRSAEIRVQFRHVPGNLYRSKLGLDLDRATNEARRLEIENDRLDVERRAQATPVRVEKLAREQLHMRTITPAITQYATVPGGASAAPASAEVRP